MSVRQSRYSEDAVSLTDNRQELSRAVAISRRQFEEGKFIAHEELMDMLEQKLTMGVRP